MVKLALVAPGTGAEVSPLAPRYHWNVAPEVALVVTESVAEPPAARVVAATGWVRMRWRPVLGAVRATMPLLLATKKDPLP